MVPARAVTLQAAAQAPRPPPGLSAARTPSLRQIYDAAWEQVEACAAIEAPPSSRAVSLQAPTQAPIQAPTQALTRASTQASAQLRRPPSLSAARTPSLRQIYDTAWEKVEACAAIEAPPARAPPRRAASRPAEAGSCVQDAVSSVRALRLAPTKSSRNAFKRDFSA